MASSDIIKLLPDSVANQIAAGEVIQRPASVVKELVENAVDAGATDITIVIKDAGRTLIQVIDNGMGMSPTDARMAFERHATSKIAAADDLYSLRTMGFRGEALASIAAVAQIEMRTMRHDDSMGFRLCMAASKVEEQEACVCTPGTNLMVKNLFAYLPARRKFLKKDSIELGHIVHEFERLALVNTGIAFTLTHNGTTIHRLMRGTLRQRIGELFGNAMEKQVVPLSTSTPSIKISGYVGLPQHTRRRGAHQYLFVNGRNMRHPYFHRAVMSCYEHLTAPEMQPSYFIDFTIDPSRIDVNIHPQKHEIKFEDEQMIWQVLVAAVREALGKTNAAGAIDFDVENAPDIPAFAPDTSARATVYADSNYNPFTATLATDSTPHRAPAAPSLAEVRSTLNIMEHTRAAGRQLGLDELPDRPADVKPDHGLSPQTGSYITIANRFIATPVRDGIMLIDRHRAHVRVIYERILSHIAAGEVATQRMIFPEIISPTASEEIVLSSICDSLAALGFDLSPQPNGTWIINGMPSALDSCSPSGTVLDVIRKVAESGENPDNSLFDTIAITMARNAAVNATNRLNEAETDELVAELFKTASPNITPDGCQIIATVSIEEIGRMLAVGHG